MSGLSERIRKEWKENDAKRDAGLTTPPTVTRYDDIPYGTDSRWQRLDVYRPKNSKETLPVIISVHGGGWVYGDKELYQFYCMNLAERGFAVINYTYRLAPEFKFPAALEDTLLVCRWLLQNATQYGLDTDNVFAAGDSAGAHLLGLLLTFQSDTSFAARFPFSQCAVRIQAAALNCGMFRIRREDKSGIDDMELMKDLMPQQGTEEELALIDIPSHVTPSFPPLYLMTATDDFLKQQTPLLAQSLCKHRVPYELHCYANEQDGKRLPLYHVFHVDIRSPKAIRCNDDECRFFREHIQHTESHQD